MHRDAKLPKLEWDPQAFASFWINHASRLLMRLFEEELRPLGFGMAYLPVAFALSQNEKMLQKELATEAHVEQPTMAALLTRMERDGLIEREPHPSDKRASYIALTKKARGAMPEARKRLFTVAERLTEGFTAAERDTFIALLRRAAANLER